MDDISYGELDYRDAADVERVARLHEEAPLDWIDGFEVRDEAVAEVRRLIERARDDADRRVLTARAADGRLLGFHWIEVEGEQGKRRGAIRSLWVDPAYRRRGIARRLKRLGEAWMRERGAVRVTTTVFYVNTRMIEFNLKEGFTPGQVTMTKKL